MGCSRDLNTIESCVEFITR